VRSQGRPLALVGARETVCERDMVARLWGQNRDNRRWEGQQGFPLRGDEANEGEDEEEGVEDWSGGRE
jgi:hypothetical protein